LGLSVAGGRVGGVGVGGLTLGGGLSFFGPRYGWTCDTVSAFEVVLANGSIVEANTQSNPDLFQALKGGSSNFGVVTRVDLIAFEQQGLWFGNVGYPLSTIDAQAAIVADMTRPESYDPGASFIMGFAYSQAQGGVELINNQLAYTLPFPGQGEGISPSYYQELMALDTIFSSSITSNMTTLARQAASFLPPGEARYLFATTTFLPTERMLRAAFDAWNSSLTDELKAIRGLTWSLSLDPVPQILYQHHHRHNTKSKNALGLDDRQTTNVTGTLVICLLSPVWEDAADDERVYAAARQLITDIEEAARRLHAYDRFLYLNYAADWQDPIASYGKGSVEMLRKVRDRVDPDAVFMRRFPGGFKIPEA